MERINMIKKYKQYNEGIKHLLVGPNEEEIFNNIKNKYMTDMLFEFCKLGSLMGVKYAVENGADINSYNEEKFSSPLRWSVIHEHIDIVKYLIENGSDVNLYREHTDGPLIVAAHRGQLEMVKILFKITNKDKYCKALTLACCSNMYDVVKYLTDNGVNPNDYKYDNKNPLFNAIYHGRYEITKLLLDKGADVKQLYKSENNELFNRLEGNKKMVELIENYL